MQNVAHDIIEENQRLTPGSLPDAEGWFTCVQVTLIYLKFLPVCFNIYADKQQMTKAKKALRTKNYLSCKLMEHIIASNLTKHLNKHNVLYDLQHGFREKRSCETQLIQLVDELARGLSQGYQTDLILLDFSKAFDKVSHTKLLFKLHQHGITQNNLSWIKAFLLGRSQCVALEGKNCLKFRSHRGCPKVRSLDQSCSYYT